MLYSAQKGSPVFKALGLVLSYSMIFAAAKVLASTHGGVLDLKKEISCEMSCAVGFAVLSSIERFRDSRTLTFAGETQENVDCKTLNAKVSCWVGDRQILEIDGSKSSLLVDSQSTTKNFGMPGWLLVDEGGACELSCQVPSN